MASSVRSISTGGKIRKLVYSTSIISLNKSDTLVFDINEPSLQWSWSFIFSSDEKKAFTTSLIENFEQSKVEITLHNWDHYDWVEVTEPMTLTLSDINNITRSFQIKFRTYSDKDMHYRQFDLTIWED